MSGVVVVVGLVGWDDGGGGGEVDMFWRRCCIGNVEMEFA